MKKMNYLKSKWSWWKPKLERLGQRDSRGPCQLELLSKHFLVCQQSSMMTLFWLWLRENTMRWLYIRKQSFRVWVCHKEQVICRNNWWVSLIDLKRFTSGLTQMRLVNAQQRSLQRSLDQIGPSLLTLRFQKSRWMGSPSPKTPMTLWGRASVFKKSWPRMQDGLTNQRY